MTGGGWRCVWWRGSGCAARSFLAGLWLICAWRADGWSGSGVESGRGVEVVEGVESGIVELTVQGLVAVDEPRSYVPVHPWIPVSSLARDGSLVQPGDELFTLSLGLARQWDNWRRAAIAESEAEREVNRTEGVGRVQALEFRKLELEQKVELFGAQVAATRKRDAAELRIAELELGARDRALSDAAERAARMEKLKAEGAAGLAEWRQSLDELALAEQDRKGPAARLEVLRSLTGRISRDLLSLEREMALLELGDAEHPGGVFGDLAAQEREVELKRSAVGERMKVHYLDRARAERLFSNNVARADLAGVVRFTSQWGDKPRLGTRARASSMVAVLRPEDLCFRVELPERWRDLLALGAVSGSNGLATRIEVPQLGVRDLAARIVSVSSSPRATRVLGLRAYDCLVMPEEPVPGLCENMQVSCALRIAVPAGAVRVPIWAVDGGVEPRVRLEDGSLRPVRGLAIGSWYVVTAGLRVGERVLSRAGAGGNGGRRLSGKVRPVEQVELVVPNNVEIVEMVEDGAPVRRGDVVARLARTDGKEGDDVQAAAVLRAEAQAQLEIGRIKADTELTQSYVKWRKAVLGVRRDRLRHWVARYESNEDEQVAGSAALVRAELSVARCEREVRDREGSRAQGTASLQSLREAQLARDLAGVELARAELACAAIGRSRDWLGVWEKQESAYQSGEAAETARADYSIQRGVRSLAMKRAMGVYQGAMDKAHRLVTESGRTTVYAPIDGRVFYGADPGGVVLETGRQLRTTRPFFMPVGPEREVEIEVPANLYGRFSPGMRVRVHVPTLDDKPREAVVKSVAPCFRASKADQDEYLFRDDIGLAAPVFVVVVSVPVAAGEVDRVPPGVNAWIEVDT